MSLRKNIPFRSILLFSIVIAAIVVSFLLWESDIRELMERGIRYADSNLFLVAMILYLTLASDIFLPVPSVLAGGFCGLFLGVVPGFITSFLAMTTSSAIGYIIGVKSEKLTRCLLGNDEMEVLSKIHKRGGPFLLLGLRPVPILSEASMVFAGLVRTPVKKTVILVSLGNAVVAAVYAIMGAMFRSSEDFTGILFLVCFTLSGIFMLIPVFKGIGKNIDGR
jgi:uncharacterized membrane protein YdjX (TVP38/TMEM64 family)